MNEKLTKTSKYLSKILRHDPGKIGLTLDAQGWAQIDELLTKSGMAISRDMLEEVVAKNNKKRFAISEDGTRIRASQGHSIKIDLGYSPADPPEVLYHGTAMANLSAIMAQGLDKRNRHHVHLSAETTTAETVGARHGKPVVLRVDAVAMQAAGHAFFVSENGVWLTDHVPPQFLSQ